MLLQRSLLRPAASLSSRSFLRNASTLVLLEHRGSSLAPASLNAITAAHKLGGDVVGLLAGGPSEGVSAVSEAAKSLRLSKILSRDAPQYEHGIAEHLAPLVAELAKKHSFSHVIAPHSAFGKNVLPRVAALLDVAQVSDVVEIQSEDTFVRPIYAGNAIATVKSKDPVKVLTIRSTAFEPIQPDNSSAAIEKLDQDPSVSSAPEWVSEELVKSERPDLGSATRVVSGGRALKNKENFDKLITPLADALGAAVGASRAAVDAGYCDNSLQVGQTGKVVAPQLYVAVGISGAIQHIAGMKDAKIIVAINKNPDEPIFQIADLGLVGDLYTIIPELTEKLKK